MQSPRQLLVSVALAYSNGKAHIGHLREYVDADIWVRFQKLQGNQCYFIGGEDAHGTPVMLAAEANQESPEALIEKVFQERKQDLSRFHIDFDYYGTTHCAENEELITAIYNRLHEKGHIKTKLVKQAYDTQRGLFLPDRYVKGSCPYCDAEDQYGDNCDSCGATYEPLELKNPRSILSGSQPEERSSEQYFFTLNEYSAFLKKWIQSGTVPQQAVRKLLEWFNSDKGLTDLAISREAPYFGFRIPNTQDKYFYVWIDAPVGYMAIFKKLTQSIEALNFQQYWEPHSSTELYHFVGKDIVKFHALFWPAMLKGADFRLPTRLFIHGFLTVDGKKMSKSKGTFITAENYLRHLDPEHLRYYLASKMNGTIEDIDLNWEDFIQKTNSDCVGKFVNIASRCAKLLDTHFDNRLSLSLENNLLFKNFVTQGTVIANYFDKQQYHLAIREIMRLTDLANQYLAEKQPWKLVKHKHSLHEAQQVCTTGLNLFKLLATYLSPVLPKVAQKTAQFLNVGRLDWSNRSTPLLDYDIQPYVPLLERTSISQIEMLLNKSTDT